MSRVQLLVDAGNSRVKWALFQGDALGAVESTEHDEGALLSGWKTLPMPASVIISNVGGDKLSRTLDNICRDLWGCEPRFAAVTKQMKGLTVAYDQPEKLGVDRWLAMLAVWRSRHCPALVIDCGTATTLDAVSAEGRHLGGLIVPGLRTMWSALMSQTRIPPVPFKFVDNELGKDTGACIAAGALQGLAGLVERMNRRLVAQHDVNFRVILTGSDAETVGQQLDIDYEIQPNLVLRGLSALED